MSFNPDGGILTNVTRYFSGPLFRAKTTKGAHVKGLALTDGRFDQLKIGFHDRAAKLGIKAGLLADLVNYILFCHR